MGWFQIGKEYIKAVYCHPVYFTYTQSTTQYAGLDEEQEISVTSDMQMTPPLWQKVKRN